MGKIFYKKGYKYQLHNTYRAPVPIFPKEIVKSDYLLLTPTGRLVIQKGYCWDGPSGPAVDTPSFMRGSLVHDALYQLMREGALPNSCRKIADKTMYKICREDGMWWGRAKYCEWAVRRFARKSSLPQNKRKICTAP